MTWRKREIMDMAREAGIGWAESLGGMPKFLEAFAKLVREDEREACAKLCGELVPDMSRTANDASVWEVATFDCATAIRARGDKHD